jgi:hypothetical protein
MAEVTWDGTRWSDDDPKTDEEKHVFCQRRWGCNATFISAILYAMLEKQGNYDMRQFVINKPVPQSPYLVEHKLPTSAQMRAAMDAQIKAGLPLGVSHNGPPMTFITPGSLTGYTEYARTPRKHIPEGRICSGKDCVCMAGLGGKCVLCDNHD